MIIDAPALSEPMGVLAERQPSPCRLHSTVMGVKISSHWFRILPLDIPKHESFGVPNIDRGTRRCLQAGFRDGAPMPALIKRQSGCQRLGQKLN